MRLNRFSVGVWIWLVTSNAHAANIVNFGSEYAVFVSASQGKTIQETEIEWKKFEARHQSIYDEAVFRKDDGGTEERAEQKRQAFFAEYESLTPKMTDLFSDADQIVRDQETRFRVIFPDLASDIPVIFLPSLSAFNGKVKELSAFGRPTLLLGVDFIVKRNDNLNVLFAHEFFHVYHESHLSPGSTGKTMATPLWKEGFATYVSGVLNPGQTDDVLLMDASLSKSCSDRKSIAAMATSYLAVIGTDGSTSYDDWFMMSGPTQPTRRGYCLGLSVIRSLARSHALTEMISWDETRFSRESVAALQDLAKP